MDWLETLVQTFFDGEAMLNVLPQMLGTGLKNTLTLSLWAMVIGLILGMIVALMGISSSRWLRYPARIYTDIFRGLPEILTILLIGQGFARVSQDLLGASTYPLGIAALSLISSAYIGEIFRSGIQSIDKGQLEACRALGMNYVSGMRLIVVPQGIRRVLPALVNQFIATVKASSLVYFLGLLVGQRELFRVGQDAAILSGNLSPLVVAGIFYLVITVPLTHIVNYMDAKFHTGRRKAAPPRSGMEEVEGLDEQLSERTS